MKSTKIAATTNDICPVCRTGQLRLKTGTYETVFNDGEEEKALKVPDMSWFDCEHCGEVVLDDNAMDRIDQAKYRTLGLLTPADIMAIRVRLQKTQEQMAALLGIGKKTYCRWENGTFFQIRVNDRYLRWIARMLDECPEAIEILKELAGETPEKSPKPKTVGIASHERRLSPEGSVMSSPYQFDPNLSGHGAFRKRDLCCAGKA